MMVERRTPSVRLTPRQREIIARFDEDEGEPAQPRKVQSAKGVGRRLLAAHQKGRLDAGPNHLLGPLNRLRDVQRRGALDEAAWEKLVLEFATMFPKDRFIVPKSMPWLGRPIAWAVQAIDDLATRGKRRKGAPYQVGPYLLDRYMRDFDAKEAAVCRALEHGDPSPKLSGNSPLLPTEDNLFRLVYGYNCDGAKRTLLEFWHAPSAWRRQLRVCAWRRCQRYFLPKTTSRACRPSCAVSLSRERRR